MENESGRTISFLARTGDTDTRIDLYLAFNLKELTRSRIQVLIKGGNVKVNNSTVKTGYRLKADDEITIYIPPSSPYLLKPEPLDFSIIYEDYNYLLSYGKR